VNIENKKEILWLVD